MKNLLFAICLVVLGCDSGVDTNGSDALGTDSTVPAVKDGKAATAETPMVPTDAGVSYSGGVFCQVPMPTAEMSQKPERFILTNTDVVGKCEVLRQQPPTGAIWNGKSNVTFGMADCQDAAHDFSGTTGLSWCLNVTNCQVSQERQTCDVATFGIMGPSRPQRVYAACSASGVFLGWAC